MLWKRTIWLSHICKKRLSYFCRSRWRFDHAHARRAAANLGEYYNAVQGQSDMCQIGGEGVFILAHWADAGQQFPYYIAALQKVWNGFSIAPSNLN